MADKCHFGHSQASLGKVPSQDLGRKRQLDDEECADSLELSTSDVGDYDYEVLGYAPFHILAGLDTNSAVRHWRNMIKLADSFDCLTSNLTTRTAQNELSSKD